MSVPEFEPLIIAFGCNWCTYAAADLAGTARLRYPHNVRLIRVMCSGMIDPIYVLEAFEGGADGVLIAGCHYADCHYIDGPVRCDDMFSRLKKIINTLGLDERRLRREMISTSEGIVYARVIEEMVADLKKVGPSPFKKTTPPLVQEKGEALSLEDIVKETKTFYCLECGKCSGLCPISRRNPAFLPWALVENALLGLEDGLVHNRELFSCLACYACQLKCPADVDYPLFAQKVRTLALAAGEHGDYAHSGVTQCLMRLMAVPTITQRRLEWLSQEYSVSERGDVLFFVGCAPYFEHVFNFEPKALDIIRASLRILNFFGVKPVMLSNERCCGHDALWAGDIETFKKLAEHNAAQIKEVGAKKVIFSCPECYRTFKKDYPNYVSIDCEFQHISEFLWQQIDGGKAKFGEIKKRVTYHDSCRLGRHLGIYEAPRKVIESIPGLELVEMERNKEGGLCCGSSAFTNCDSCSKQIQTERLLEAKATGAELLVTSCPKCQIHFRCAMVNKGEEKNPDIEIEIMDVASLVANVLGDNGHE
jgi:Fe-S oxidoreductase/coenzyme F420-reducing hydrogenase delta subunit